MTWTMCASIMPVANSPTGKNSGNQQESYHDIATSFFNLDSSDSAEARFLQSAKVNHTSLTHVNSEVKQFLITLPKTPAKHCFTQ